MKIKKKAFFPASSGNDMPGVEWMDPRDLDRKLKKEQIGFVRAPESNTAQCRIRWVALEYPISAN